MADIIDCHTHIGIDYFWSKIGVFPHSQSLERLLAQMDKNGVASAVVFPMASSPFFSYQSMANGKREVSGKEAFPYESSNGNLIAKVQGLETESQRRFYPFFCFSPLDKTDEQIKFLQENLDRGFLKGLKYHPYAAQTRITASENKPFLDFANEHHLPFVLHYGLDHFSSGEGLLDMVSRYGNIRFSIAHIARFDGNILDHVNELPNVFFDVSCLSGECQMALSFSLTDVYKGYAKRTYDFGNPGKVLQSLVDEFPNSALWGTDAPFTSLKEKGGKIHYGSSYSNEVRILHTLGDEAVGRVASRNPQRWLGKQSTI